MDDGPSGPGHTLPDSRTNDNPYGKPVKAGKIREVRAALSGAKVTAADPRPHVRNGAIRPQA